MLTARLRASHWTAWLAAWAILLGALAPTVTHWLTQLQASNTLPGATICSSSAHQSTRHKGTRPDSSASGQHCGFCLPHDGGQGLPPVVAQALPLMEHRAAEPSLFLHAPRPLFAWASAQPRAPPLA